MAQLAAREGVSARFAQHIYSVMNYATAAAIRHRKPQRDGTSCRRRMAIPRLRKQRRGPVARNLEKFVTSWPSWLFARGDKAVGGAGDESPLVFTDAALKAELSHHFIYNIGGAEWQRQGRGDRARSACI